MRPVIPNTVFFNCGQFRSSVHFHIFVYMYWVRSELPDLGGSSSLISLQLWEIPVQKNMKKPSGDKFLIKCGTTVLFSFLCSSADYMQQELNHSISFHLCYPPSRSALMKCSFYEVLIQHVTVHLFSHTRFF
jgi:hypothetical protein